MTETFAHLAIERDRRRRHAVPRSPRQAQRAAPSAVAQHPCGGGGARRRPGGARHRAGRPRQGVLRRHRPDGPCAGLGGRLADGRSDGSAVAKRRQLYDDIRAYQRTCSSFADTNKPVIAAVHGACIGAGMDLITACDIRLASAEATFSVRETRIAMVADVGSLQRLPRVIGDGAAREWIFTGADYTAQQAREVQLLNEVLPDPAALMARAHGNGGRHRGQFTARRAGLEAGARLRVATRGGQPARLRGAVERRVPAFGRPRRGDAGIHGAPAAELPRTVRRRGPGRA